MYEILHYCIVGMKRQPWRVARKRQRRLLQRNRISNFCNKRFGSLTGNTSEYVEKCKNAAVIYLILWVLFAAKGLIIAMLKHEITFAVDLNSVLRWHNYLASCFVNTVVLVMWRWKGPGFHQPWHRLYFWYICAWWQPYKIPNPWNELIPKLFQFV